jgi:hypothetical protein
MNPASASLITLCTLVPPKKFALLMFKKSMFVCFCVNNILRHSKISFFHEKQINLIKILYAHETR